MIVVFSLSTLWWRRLMEASWWKRQWGKLGLVLVSTAMLSKCLIQFSVEVLALSSLLFDLRPNYGGGDEDKGDLLQNVPCTATLSAPNPATCHRWHMPPPENAGHSQASLVQSLVGSLLLSPRFWCTQVSICPVQEAVSPVLCKFWQLYGGLMVTSSKGAYAAPRSIAPRALVSEAGHCWPVPPQETPNTVLSQSLWGLWVLVNTMYDWALWTFLGDMGFESNVISPLLLSCTHLPL